MKRAKGGGGHRRTWSAAAATSTPVAPAVKSDDHVDERHPWSEVLLPSASEWREMEESSSVPHGGKVWTKTALTTLTEAKGWGLGGGGRGSGDLVRHAVGLGRAPGLSPWRQATGTSPRAPGTSDVRGAIQTRDAEVAARWGPSNSAGPFSIEISSDLKWISNENLEKFLGLEFDRI
jgi:hypothetical protein